MKLFDKLKNILFEEEEVEIPIIKNSETHEVEKESIAKEDTEEVSRFKNKSFESEKAEHVEEIIEPKEEKSPFQQFDEEEFERIAAINKNKLLERDRRAREEHSRIETHSYEKTYDYEPPKRHEEKPIKEEPKHFVLSPVISPVYGILDKNYSKEDLLPKASSDGTLPKVMDVDSVRKKAFGALEVDIEDVIKKNEDEKLIINDDNDTDELVKTAEIKITSFDDSEPVKEDYVDEELPEEAFDDKVVEDNNIIEELDAMSSPSDDTKEKEKPKNDDALESDLFNLIDSMYQEKGENK